MPMNASVRAPLAAIFYGALARLLLTSSISSHTAICCDSAVHRDRAHSQRVRECGRLIIDAPQKAPHAFSVVWAPSAFRDRAQRCRDVALRGGAQRGSDRSK
jgi:hypothetical protein